MKLIADFPLTKAKRSPLKGKPLRNPGQSLDEHMRDLVSAYAIGPALFALILSFVAVLEWLKYVESVPPRPVLYFALALAAVAYAVFRFFWVKRKFKALQLGRDGEKDVGQKLELLRKGGYEVFHDVIGDGFNLDHVLIGPAGIFTIETKTHSKPLKGNPPVVFDGEQILIGGSPPDRNPIVQAKAQASWLRELLRGTTGRKFAVRPVIAYPGWFVENRSADRRTIWVLNPKGLPSFLDHEPVHLKPEDICLASSGLSRYITTDN
jgi:hypothetical protein